MRAEIPRIVADKWGEATDGWGVKHTMADRCGDERSHGSEQTSRGVVNGPGRAERKSRRTQRTN
jgi:hypothetical protein